MLRTVGLLADGWLSSQSYLKPGDLGRGNSVIEGAAVKAGRDPREIVRLLNIGSNSTPAELADLALSEGISTFIVAADDRDTIDFVARELAPAARELIADAVRFAAANRDRNHAAGQLPVPFGIFSAGPGISGRSLNRGGIVINSMAGTGHLRPPTPWPRGSATVAY